jgi:hypothetical protein
VSNLAGLRPEAVNSTGAVLGSHDIIVRAMRAPNPNSEALNAFIVLIELKIKLLVIVSKFGCKVTIYFLNHQTYWRDFLLVRPFFTDFHAYLKKKTYLCTL